MKEGANIREAFYRRLPDDPCLGTAHIALFMALYQLWCEEGEDGGVLVKRKTVMALAKISSPATYHHCLRTLVQRGYLRYAPSFDHSKGSVISWGIPEVPAPLPGERRNTESSGA